MLDEPLATLCDHLALQQLLRSRVDEGCCVVVTSRNGEQLHGVGKRLVLEQGELREPPAQVTTGLWVQLADAVAARQLAQRLLAHQALASLQLELGEHDATLTLRGAELSVLSRAVTDIVLDGRLPLLQLQPLHHPAAAEEVPHG